MPTQESYINERLDHLGIVVGVCQEIGLARLARCSRPHASPTGERRNSNSSHDPQRLRLQPVHHLILALLGPLYENI